MEQNQSTPIVREVVVQYRGPSYTHRTAIREARDASPLVRKILPDNSREHFVAIHLDGAHTVIGFSRFTGIANACSFHPREVLQPAILLGAVSLLVAHNHPSGQCDPSGDDDKVTRCLRDSSAILGVKLLDHVILGDGDNFYSYAEHGRM